MTGYFLCFYRNIYEMKPDIFEIFRPFSTYLEKNGEFPETYLGEFSWYFYLGLSISCNPGKCKELTMRKKGFVEELCKIHNIPECSELNF